MELGFFLLLLIGVVVGSIKAYNELNPLWHRIDEASANIDVMIHKRNELTRRLNDIAEHYVGHERLIQLRASSDRNREPTGPTTFFFAGLAASFPQLRADQTYLRLMSDLTALESEVQRKYETYNASAREYNAARASLPNLLFVGLMGFNQIGYLEPSTRYPTPPTPQRNRIRIR